MKKIFILLLTAVALYGCTETEGEKVVMPYTKIAGEYVLTFELTQPVQASAEENMLIFNTANSMDSLWIEESHFFDSKVKVKWDGGNTFSAVEGIDIANGEIVNITGEFFPETDGLHIEWRYLQGTGDPADDYVVVADGVRYNGITN